MKFNYSPTIKKTQKEWQSVFFITACIYMIGGIVTVIYATKNQTKPWALEAITTTGADDAAKLAEETPLKQEETNLSG